MHLRPALACDLASICQFSLTEEELFFAFPKARFPLDNEQLAQAISQRSDATVVLDGDTPVGFANFYRWEYGSCAIGNVMVAPAQRGRGIGHLLIEHMCHIAWDKHAAREVTVSCFNHNTAGLLLYPQLGFVPYAIEQRHGNDGQPLALIHFRLPRPL